MDIAIDAYRLGRRSLYRIALLIAGAVAVNVYLVIVLMGVGFVQVAC